MEKLSFKKLSLLGLVLMGASIVTAAMIPSKSASKKKVAKNGNIIANGDELNDDTCVTAVGTATCYNTDTLGAVEGALTSTTGEEEVTSGEHGQPEDGSNTTVDDDAAN